MKRLIPAGMLIVFIIAMCICGNLYVTQICNSIEKDLTLCEKEYVNGNITTAHTAKLLCKRWHEAQERLAVFVNHSMLDSVSEHTARMAAYAQSTNFENFTAECYQIRTILKRIKEEQHLIAESFY